MEKDFEIDVLHQLTLELLVKFDQLCKLANVKYYLSGGTLLGAVRHQGFIPWDDDADVMMMRDDYMKLIKEQKKYLDLSQFQILSVVDETYPRDFSRFVRKDYYKSDDCVEDMVCPYIGIDIFPVDFVPHNKYLFNILFYFLSFFKRLMGIYGSKKDTGSTFLTKKMRNLLRPFVCMVGGYKLAKIVQAIEVFSNAHCKISVASLAGINGKREKWEYTEYEAETKLKFENYFFSCPLNYDIYLKHLYKDYMELPSIENRITHGIRIIKHIGEEK